MKTETFNSILVFIVGLLIGGIIMYAIMLNPEPVTSIIHEKYYNPVDTASDASIPALHDSARAKYYKRFHELQN